MFFSGERSHKRELVGKCQSVWGNFDFYFTIGETKNFMTNYEITKTKKATTFYAFFTRHFYLSKYSMFTGMLSFFLFWGTLLFHIWPPSLYMTEVRMNESRPIVHIHDEYYFYIQDMMFWRRSASSPSPSPLIHSLVADDPHHHTAVLEIDLDN